MVSLKILLLNVKIAEFAEQETKSNTKLSSQ